MRASLAFFGRLIHQVELLSARLEAQQEARREAARRMAQASMDEELQKNAPGAWSKALSGLVQPIAGVGDALGAMTPSGLASMAAGMALADRGRVESFGRKAIKKQEEQEERPASEREPSSESVRCSGLRWRNVGKEKPSPGRGLTNRLLSEALARGFTEFSQEEWDKFGVKELVMEHYVGAKGAYFVPAATYAAVPVEVAATGISWKTRWKNWKQQ